MNASSVELPAIWRARAASLRPYAEAAARAFERAADELEASLHSPNDEILTLTTASALSGYSVDHLRRLVKQGKLPNVGRPGSPRIRQQDLPRKPGLPPAEPIPHLLGATPRQLARAVATKDTR